MELRQFELFLVVAEELHFGRAAARLHMAQPPLSQQIRLLEKRLGVQLFERTTRSVALTSSGKALLGHAKGVLEAAQAAERAAKAADLGDFGNVTLGFAGAATRHLLPQLALKLKEAYPNIELDLRGNIYANTALEEIARGALDIGFIRLPYTLPGLSYRPIEEETLYCVVSEGHRLAEQSNIQIAELQNELFVTFPSGSGSTLRAITNRVCWDAGFSPKVFQEAPDSYTIHAMVAAGQGVSLALSSTIDIRQPGVVYIPISGDAPSFQIALAWNDSNKNPALKNVLKIADNCLPYPAQDIPRTEHILLN